MDSQQIAGSLALLRDGFSVREFKTRFSELAAGLAQRPVIVKSNGTPFAVLVDIAQYQETLAKAEAYDRDRLDKGGQQPSLTTPQPAGFAGNKIPTAWSPNFVGGCL